MGGAQVRKVRCAGESGRAQCLAQPSPRPHGARGNNRHIRRFSVPLLWATSKEEMRVGKHGVKQDFMVWDKRVPSWNTIACEAGGAELVAVQRTREGEGKQLTVVPGRAEEE